MTPPSITSWAIQRRGGSGLIPHTVPCMMWGASGLVLLLSFEHLRQKSYLTAASMLMLCAIYYGILQAALVTRPTSPSPPFRPSEKIVVILFFVCTLFLIEYYAYVFLAHQPNVGTTATSFGITTEATGVILSIFLLLGCALFICAISLVSFSFMLSMKKTRTL